MAGFESLELSESIRKALKEMKYEEPTPIQAEALPSLF